VHIVTPVAHRSIQTLLDDQPSRGGGEVFTEPERFDVTRGNTGEHLSFSSGPHYYLGAARATG
jgi:hypothetical protein